jgi:proteic killer suppression protein
MVRRVVLGATAQRSLRRTPQHIADKLLAWAELVSTYGLEEARKVPGYHDEPLRGMRRGQRSVRLSKGYRPVYTLRSDAGGVLAVVEEVTKHDY